MSFFRGIFSQARSRHKITPSATKPAPACDLVILGAYGDLTKRLLIPAVYNLACSDLLVDNFRIIALDKIDIDNEGYIQRLSDNMQNFTKDENAEFYTPKINEKKWKWVTDRINYRRGDFTKVEDLKKLSTVVGSNTVFYFAIASQYFAEVVENLGIAGLVNDKQGFRRVVIEKPFGSNLKTALELNRRILSVLREDQVYRIDHFLGKETVQNILALRFGNSIFEPLWRHEYVDNIQITVTETIGVEGRGIFYERTGAFRDMVPNHLFQLFGMVAMEPPNSFSVDAVRNAKEQLFEAIRPIDPGDAVRGQYTSGIVEGRAMTGYRESQGVAPDSRVETYVAMKAHIDNWRWSGVPFYLRTGKALSKRCWEVIVEFKKQPFAMFRDSSTGESLSNLMILNIQPEQGLTVGINAKIPGPTMELAGVDLKFRYEDSFHMTPNVGYETLLYDCLSGDATLFQRADNIDAAWRAVDPVLEAWAKDSAGPELYRAGEDGPASAAELMARDGRAWYAINRR